MTDPIRHARAGDDAAVAELADAIRGWEPALDLLVARDEPRIYEPDGTLYVVLLTPEGTLTARHKERKIGVGDAIVVPASVAVEAGEPGVEFVAIRHEGRPPYHFRERFIQTWGYEFRPARSSEGGPDPVEVVPEDDVRFRVPYRRLDVEDARVDSVTGLDLHLLVGLEGAGEVATSGAGRGCVLGRGDLALVRSGVAYGVEGRLAFGRLVLRAEASHEARLASALSRSALGPSAEFGPAG